MVADRYPPRAGSTSRGVSHVINYDVPANIRRITSLPQSRRGTGRASPEVSAMPLALMKPGGNWPALQATFEQYSSGQQKSHELQTGEFSLHLQPSFFCSRKIWRAARRAIGAAGHAHHIAAIPLAAVVAKRPNEWRVARHSPADRSSQFIRMLFLCVPARTRLARD
jgi:hypothetical protein